MSNYEEILEKYRKYYLSLKPEYCPILDETIHFTGSGFNHILRKKRKQRNEKDQIRRFQLLEQIAKIISKADTVFEIRELNKVKFWSIGTKNTPKIILCKNTRGPIYFVSIIP